MLYTLIEAQNGRRIDWCRQMLSDNIGVLNVWWHTFDMITSDETWIYYPDIMMQKPKNAFWFGKDQKALFGFLLWLSIQIDLGSFFGKKRLCNEILNVC